MTKWKDEAIGSIMELRTWLDEIESAIDNDVAWLAEERADAALIEMAHLNAACCRGRMSEQSESRKQLARHTERA